MDSLRTFWRYWKKFGEFMGNIVARVVLTVFYFTIYAPFGLGVRFLGDPLAIKKNLPSGWVKREAVDASMEEMKRLS